MIDAVKRTRGKHAACRGVVAGVVLSACVAAPAATDPGAASGPPAREQPAATDIYARMLAALAPEQPVLTRVRLAAWLDDEQKRVYAAHVARRAFDDGVRTTVALESPEPVRGTVMLWGTKRNETEPVEAIYLPTERRVREVAPAMPDDSFLGSDFTRADLGLVPRGELDLTLIGESTVDQRPVFVLEGVPRESWYYSRIVTWVDAETWLPVKREYYDRAGRLWKRAEYDGAVFEGVPVITRIRMEDVQALTRSHLTVIELRVGDHEANSLFRRSYLANAGAHLARVFGDAHAVSQRQAND